MNLISLVVGFLGALTGLYQAYIIIKNRKEKQEQ